jgi:hypothetical protein
MGTLTDMQKINKVDAINLFRNNKKVFGIKKDCEILIEKISEFSKFKEFGINHKNL